MEKAEYMEYIRCEVDRGAESPMMRFYNRHFAPVTNAVFLFRKMQFLHTYEHTCSRPLAKLRVKLLQRKLALRYGILASPNAVIGLGLRFVHPTSVVIGAHVVAGLNLSLYQNTTIGGARTGDVNLGNQPVLGNNVTLFANSLVLGKITVGDNVTVGANSLLLSSVPSNSICVGSPAKIIHNKEKE